MRLRYKAATKDGKLSQGLLDARDVGEAANYLRSKELLPIQITNVDNQLLTRIPFLNSAKTTDIILFTRQLSSMLSSGLTLMRSLEILKEQLQNQKMIEVVTSIINDVSEGKTLGDAISKHPTVFSPIYISIIRAGESSGLLDKSLSRLADNLEKQAKLKSTVKGALMYPVIVIILMIVVMAVMMIFVIPQLTVLYENLNVELPLPTKIVVAISKALGTFWPIVVIALVVGFYFFRKWSNTIGGRAILDDVVLKLPVFGKLIRQTILAEFSRTFGLLVGTGTLIVDALAQSSGVTGNFVYEKAIKDIAKRVEKGVPVGEAMSYYLIDFPPLLVQLVKVGEETGKMDENLLKASEYFEEEVNQSVKTLTTAMEPLIMIILGIGVGFLVFSVITPIYSLLSAI